MSQKDCDFCLEELDENELVTLECGHMACHDCFRGLFFEYPATVSNVEA